MPCRPDVPAGFARDRVLAAGFRLLRPPKAALEHQQRRRGRRSGEHELAPRHPERSRVRGARLIALADCSALDGRQWRRHVLAVRAWPELDRETGIVVCAHSSPVYDESRRRSPQRPHDRARTEIDITPPVAMSEQPACDVERMRPLVVAWDEALRAEMPACARLVPAAAPRGSVLRSPAMAKERADRSAFGPGSMRRPLLGRLDRMNFASAGDVSAGSSRKQDRRRRPNTPPGTPAVRPERTCAVGPGTRSQSQRHRSTSITSGTPARRVSHEPETPGAPLDRPRHARRAPHRDGVLDRPGRCSTCLRRLI